MTTETIWQTMTARNAPALAAIALTCVFGAFAVWFNQGALGLWIALIALCLTLGAVASGGDRVRELLVPLFLALGALGLGFFSGGLSSVAICAILWPLLGSLACGVRVGSGIGSSLCALFGLMIVSSVIVPVATQNAIIYSGFLALAVSIALALAAGLRVNTSPKLAVEQVQAQLQEAQHDRAIAISQATEARAQNQGRAQFMAEMSHEIRTPLNAILGFADTMREGVFGPLPQPYSDYPALIHTSGSHLLDLVSDLLDLSKIEAGRYQTTLKALRLDNVAYEGVRLSSGAARAAGVQIRHEAGAAVEVAGDARVCRQIIFNLISNAIKFTPSGGRVTVRVVTDPIARVASLEVDDTGVGISATELAKIGEPWNQSSQAQRQDAKQARGSGLGLALVKRLTDLQGGKFDISSTLGAGTRARVTLPLAAAPAINPSL